MREIYIGDRISPGEMISFRKRVAERMHRDDVVVPVVCMHYMDKPECDGKCAFNSGGERLSPSFEVFFYYKSDAEAEFIDKMPEELRDDYFKLCALRAISDRWAYTWYINGKERYLCNRGGETWLTDSLEETGV